ncbi:uncharacterized protein LOC108710197 [Xenopus laevis]|uniref:Uncharacterized protein LOC108710197 n=2 Tax=Xenopus laevis TaxID=8355 RepID=A0A1L8GWY5_XENLA|nr:uncharacterized protein LOC108710197 [Xenopus laevis]OCT88344.1 hypothetical protein XELAEV_18016979mg [Xenopus laevis]
MIAVFLLLVAVSGYFTPATSQCLKQCVERCSLAPPSGNPICVQNSLARNPIVTAKVIGRVMCAFDRTKDSRNKLELILAVNSFLNVTGCPRSLVMGPRLAMDDLILDVNGLLQNMLRISVTALSPFNLANIPIPQCGLLSDLRLKIDNILKIVSGLPDLQIIKSIAGKPLGLLAILPSGLLDSLLGPVGKLVSTVGSVVGPLLNQVGSTVSGVPTILSGGGSQTWQTGAAGGSVNAGGSVTAGGPGAGYSVFPYDGYTYSNNNLNPNLYQYDSYSGNTGYSTSGAGTGPLASWDNSNTGYESMNPTFYASANVQNINAGTGVSASSDVIPSMQFK